MSRGVGQFLSAVLVTLVWAGGQAEVLSISLPVSAAKPYLGADFDNLGSAERFRYVSFPASGYSALLTDFSVPPNYTAGTAITVRYMVNSANPDCFVVLGGSSVWENPAVSASANIRFPDNAPPDPDPRWTANSSELRPFQLDISPPSGRQFEAGDSISIAIERYGDELNDTCPQEILISGMQVQVQVQ